MKKYEFTGETMTHNGVELKRIRRISDGLIGGWIEKGYNLSQNGDSFVYDNAKVYGEAWVRGDAKIYENAEVFGAAEVFGYADIYDNAKVYGGAKVFGDAEVFENTRIYGSAEVYGNARVLGMAKVYDEAKVYGMSLVYGGTKIYGENKIIGEVQMEFDEIEFYQSGKSRLVTAITKDNKTLFNVGCQKLITKETFLNRIENEDDGIEENPHREFYKRILKLY